MPMYSIFNAPVDPTGKGDGHLHIHMRWSVSDRSVKESTNKLESEVTRNLLGFLNYIDVLNKEYQNQWSDYLITSVNNLDKIGQSKKLDSLLEL